MTEKMNNVIPSIVRRAIMASNILYQLAVEKMGADATLYLGFPRDIERLVSDTFYLPIRYIPNLTLHSTGQYLCIRREEMGKDRRLYGLLHVGPPATTIFIEKQLSQRVRNYIIAHELGHYIHDIFMVQQLWLSSLQEQKAAIERAFSWQSSDPFLELQAFVKGLPERPHTITARGEAMRQETRAREIFANTIAIELLAPWHEASELFRLHRKSTCEKFLREMYGVPSKIASYYYEDLRRTLAPEPDFFEQLFALLRQNNS
jgi:Zn-dependent peptidase ImmA (M78 family)